MANVIPEDVRRAARSRSRAELILAGSLAALACAGITLLMLLPAYFVLNADASGFKETSAALSPSDIQNDNSVIMQANALLKELAPIASASSTPTGAVSAALSLLPSGVRVDQITYLAGTPSSVILAGSADTTNEISAYRSALAGDPVFSSVSIPVGALVGTDGGRFSITLSGTF